MSLVHLLTAARACSDAALGRLAVKIDRHHAWHDLVLPGPTVRRLRELSAAIRQRHIVFDDWGFGAAHAHAGGIKALFAGPSGTGKTMAAGVIARELGLDLYRIDLSGVVSKYIGETEKNLDADLPRRASRATRSCSSTKPTRCSASAREVKDAHDRYANIEVAYLLQRIEEYDGVVILATNLKQQHRRGVHSAACSTSIEFPLPDDAGARAHLARACSRARRRSAATSTSQFLARQFELAGGDIRNVVLDAAFLAAEAGGVIDMRTVVEAMARQLAKQGKTPTGSEFKRVPGASAHGWGPAQCRVKLPDRARVPCARPLPPGGAFALARHGTATADAKPRGRARQSRAGAVASRTRHPSEAECQSARRP